MPAITGAPSPFQKILLVTTQHFGIASHPPQPKPLRIGGGFKDPMHLRWKDATESTAVVFSGSAEGRADFRQSLRNQQLLITRSTPEVYT